MYINANTLYPSLATVLVFQFQGVLAVLFDI